MSSSTSSPCGACKFLRRKCVRGCVFAPHFCYEQAASHFAAIHKVFGASNASKILSHLPPADRCEAAVTISYEAQARLQDPVYGCVSQIFALQQQVVNLQAQLAFFKEQAMSNNSITSNPPDQDFQENKKNSNFNDLVGANMPYRGTGSCMDIYDTNPNPSAKYENSCFPEDNTSFGSMESLEMQYSNEHENGIWGFQDDLQSVAFGYTCNNHYSS